MYREMIEWQIDVQIVHARTPARPEKKLVGQAAIDYSVAVLLA